MKALLLAAGLGTRLKPVTDHIPKALVTVNGLTLLERNIQYLRQNGIDEVVVNVHHFADQIEQSIRANRDLDGKVFISDERAAVLETGGGLLHAAHFFRGEAQFVVMNVDILTNLDLRTMIAEHRRTSALGTLAVMDRPSSRQLLFDENMALCGWKNNNTGEERIARQTQTVLPFAFSGIQVLSAQILDQIPFTGNFSLIDVYLHLAQNEVLKGYDHTGDHLIDVGKPDAIAKAAMIFK